MNPITAFIESGILELYVMGVTSPEENLEVEQMAAAHPEVKQEIEAISQAMEQYTMAHAVEPRGNIKPLLLATVDYIERMKQGELPEAPPVLTEASQLEDYRQWIERADMGYPAETENIYARIIGYTPAATTAIVWIKDSSGFEVHHDEHERFLILEGTCDFTVGEAAYQLKAGDFFAIPLHIPHKIKVTSEIPCKAILQRLSVA